MERFRMARGGATRLLWPLVRGEQHAEVGEGQVRLRYGALGGFSIPVGDVDRLGRIRWPWWSGLGVRIGFKLVAFVGRSGDLALIELSKPARVRMPFPWTTTRIAVGVDDLDGFLRTIATARARFDLERPPTDEADTAGDEGAISSR
jgi:hypothetical protein